MKNNITELVFILDRSGSMAPLTDDTIGGFNSLLAKQQREEGYCYVTTVLFNDHADTLHDRLPLEEAEEMTTKTYCPQGSTALLDALGDTISRIADIHRYIRPEDVPSKTLFIITTDGMENASRRYTAERIREMIRRQTEINGWEFLFLAANIDAIRTAEAYGIDRQYATGYCPSREGTAKMYHCMERAVSAVKKGRPLAPDWAKDLSDEEEKNFTL